MAEFSTFSLVAAYNILVGICGLADQWWVYKHKVVDLSPVLVNRLCPWVKHALYHNSSSRFRCVNGYQHYWEGNRLVIVNYNHLCALTEGRRLSIVKSDRS